MKTLLNNLQKLCHLHYLHYHLRKEELMMISKTNHKDQEEQRELVEEENYLGDSQSERERFTDDYHEDFTD